MRRDIWGFASGFRDVARASTRALPSPHPAPGGGGLHMRGLDKVRPPVSLATPTPDRRRDSRKPLQGKAILTILEGPSANSTHEITTGHHAFRGVSFTLHEGM